MARSVAKDDQERTILGVTADNTVTLSRGGGGLVQHLKKSYSLSDLTGEKEDENRNTPHTHDETDMQVEPRRREHAGRRGYSPRRTQSSSNRVDMYFSEVDVDVRQPRSREPTSSLTNIRSSDDISSGYSSGEALQSTRSSHGDSSLVRTSSVGTKTRAKPHSTTKKSTEDSGEESDNIEHPSSMSFPPPLNLITPEQALQILLLLSQNSNIANCIKFDRGSFVAVNDDIFESTSQSGPEPNRSESVESDVSSLNSALTAEVQIIESIELTAVPENSSKEEITNDSRKEELEMQQITPEATTNNSIGNQTSPAVPEEVSVKSENTVTDELCRNKFDELKQLLNDAHKAVNNIVHTQEQVNNDAPLTGTEKPIEREEKMDGAPKRVESLEKFEETTMFGISSSNTVSEKENAATLDVWTTPNVSRSSSESLSRAGKYNKKPAPRVPLATSKEDLNETDAQSALKATLVIKTGTLKTFSNTSSAKDVFIARDMETKAKGKKSKKQRTKEGFSKLLTIPKNIFHNTFHRDPRNGTKDDSSSDISGQMSRSNSIEPRESIVELALKSSESSQERNTESDETSNSSNSYVLAPNVVKEDAIEVNIEGNSQLSIGGINATSVEPEIREMSQSPKAGRKLESDIF